MNHLTSKVVANDHLTNKGTMIECPCAQVQEQ